MSVLKHLYTLEYKKEWCCAVFIVSLWLFSDFVTDLELESIQFFFAVVFLFALFVSFYHIVLTGLTGTRLSPCSSEEVSNTWNLFVLVCRINFARLITFVGNFYISCYYELIITKRTTSSSFTKQKWHLLKYS